MVAATNQRVARRRHHVLPHRNAGPRAAPRSDGPIAIRHLLPRPRLTVRRIPVFVVGRSRRRLRWIEVVRRELAPPAWTNAAATRNQPSEDRHDY